MKTLNQIILLLSTVLAASAQSIRLEVLTSFDRPNGSSPHGNLVQGPDGSFYGTTDGGLSGVGTVFRVTTNGELTTLAYFNGANGAWPNSLALGNDGIFYGTCGGGVAGNVFQVTTNGTLTAWFPFGGGNGSQPEGALTLSADGNFYGTTAYGGAYDGGVGTAFRVTTNGVVTTLVSFSYSGGYSPAAGLTLGNDGNFYGTTYEGGFAGGAGYGTVFRLTTNGTLTHLIAFNNGNGANPKAGLTQGNDGNFYGTTSKGGGSGKGTIFQVTTNGDLTLLVSFIGTNGASPQASVSLGSDGDFYGTTSAGGLNGQGTIFKVTTNGTLTTLVSFAGGNGAVPLGGLTLGSDGFFYGTTSAGGVGGWGTVFRLTTNGTLTTLVSFTGGKGRNPRAGLTLGKDGNLYGTTSGGGRSDQGAIFQMTTDDTSVALASFMGTNGADSRASLTPGNDGSFFGTTYSGGTSNKGTVFRVTTNGALNPLVLFAGTNGANPAAGLTPANDGSFYGTTYNGGTGNKGTIFQVSTNGVLTVLVSFAGTNGANPMAGLATGNDGNYYGTTYSGGTSNKGTIFRVTTNGVLTALVSFVGTNGSNPEARLTLGIDDNFYGTTYAGGNFNQGTVYRVTTNGVLTTLASFGGFIPSGGNPQSSLTLGDDGNFYGTTRGTSLGSIFRVTTNGALTILVTFAGSTASNSTGAWPEANLAVGNDGNLYGTTSSGGSNGMGVVFRLGILPGITVQPTKITATNGSSINFNVTASGTPLSYQWFTSSGRTAMAVPYMAGSQVQSAIVTDGGTGYSSAPKVQFVGSGIGASGTAVIDNGMVTAINMISHGLYFSGPPTIQIDNPPSTATSLLYQTNANLILSAVINADATNYFVVVTNNYGSVTSSMVGLTVFLPPQGFFAQQVETGIQLQLAGTPGYPYILQSATNLMPPINWNSMLTNPADANGNWQFVDPNLSDIQKFYRAVGR